MLPTFYSYNNYNWIKEYKCRKFKNDVCIHIKKCFIAKTIVNQYQLGIEAPNWAKNIIGKAIIVHQGVDDYTSQPSGAAGARVSCGGIIE